MMKWIKNIKKNLKGNADDCLERKIAIQSLEEMKKLNCWICASFLSFYFESGIESVNLKNFSCEKY